MPAENQKSVTQYLGALVWDGIPRIGRWLIDYAAAEDTPYVRDASRAMLAEARGEAIDLAVTYT